MAAAGPSRERLRALQRYAVPVLLDVYRTWRATDVLRAVHPTLGEALLRFEDDALYDATTGLRVFDPTRRESASNVF